MAHQEVVTAQVTISNAIASGAGFAVTHGTGWSCYVPATIMYKVDAKVGDVMHAHVIKNPKQQSRSSAPYMVVFLDRGEQGTLPLDPYTGTDAMAAGQAAGIGDAEAFVREQMTDGGVWTGAQLTTEFLHQVPVDDADIKSIRNAVHRTLRKMFNAGECSKWVFYKQANQAKASREWFSCYPETVDVAEFDD